MAALIKLSVPKPTKISKWRVKKGSRVMRGSVLALYEVTDESSTSGEVSLKLKSSTNGIVEDILVEAGQPATSGTVLVTIKQQKMEGSECTHPTVMKDMCADCGIDLKREPGFDRAQKKIMSASVAMVHNIPELIVSEDQAQELGREDVMRLLKTRKLVLLVDLDQTLIHTTNDNIPADLKDVHHFQMWEGRYAAWYHTRLRPHTREFLEKMLPMYELHICTFGNRLYAHTVARLLDPDEKMFSHRILSRDECFDPGLKTANLKALFPCGDAMVCIIDDREDVWNMAPNLVKVKPYRYFKGTADINAPPGFQKLEAPDAEVGTRHGSDVVKDEKQQAGEQNDDQDASKNENENLQDAVGENEDVDKADRSGESSSCEVSEGTTGNDEQEASENCDGDVEADREVTSMKKDALSEVPRNKTETVLADSAVKSEDITNTKERDMESAGGLEVKKSGSVTEGGEEKNGTVKMECGDSVNNSAELPTAEQTVKGAGGDAGSKSQNYEATEKSYDKGNNSGDKDNNSDDKDNTKQTGNSGDADSNVTESQNAERSGSTDTNSSSAESQSKNQTEKERDEWEDEDDFLLHLGDVLTRIHSTYYSMVDEKLTLTSPLSSQQDALPDLKSLIPYMKRKTLKGCFLVFSGLVPLNMDLEKSRAYVAARSLGATVQQDIVGFHPSGKQRHKTTHLVALKPATRKHKTALKVPGIHIVSDAWLWACEERWEHCDERLFPLVPDAESSSASGRRSPASLKRKRKDSAGRSGSLSKQQKVAEQEEDASETSSITSEAFSHTVHPLLTFSDDDLECMDKEVDELMAEDGSGSDDETDEERDERYRNVVLGSHEDSDSSSDSLSGEFPRGWGQQAKLKLARKTSQDDLKHPKVKEEETEDTENSQAAFSKTLSVSSDTDDSSFADSIGSVDDEIADAVEKEFLANL